MSTALRIFLIVGVIAYMAGIIFLLSHKRMNLKYSLLWMFSAVVLLMLSIFPGIVNMISKLIGIQSPVNTVFLFFIFCMLLLLISLSSIVSKQSNEIKRLIQHLSILEKDFNDHINKK